MMNIDTAIRPVNYGGESQVSTSRKNEPNFTGENAQKVDQPVKKNIQGISKEDVEEVVKTLNDSMNKLQAGLGLKKVDEKDNEQQELDIDNSGSKSDIEFKVDNEKGHIVILIVNRQTDEVLRQIPSESLLKIRDSMEELTGLLLNKVV